MKPLRNLSLLISAIALTSPLSLAQKTVEDEDLDLFKEAVQVLEKAKLSDALDERRILQDLDLEKIPDAEAVIKEAKERLKELELQAQGVITEDALDQVSDILNQENGGEEAASSTDVLGPAPPKAPKIKVQSEHDMITIENSRKFAGSLEEGIFVFEGDVWVTSDDGMEIRCDKLEVFLNEERKRPRLAIATGRMVVIEGSSDDGPVEAKCQYAVYQEDVMYLRQWPEVSMPGRILKARDKDAYIKLVVDEDGNVDPEINGNITTSLRKPEKEDAP